MTPMAVAPDTMERASGWTARMFSAIWPKPPTLITPTTGTRSRAANIRRPWATSV